MAAKTKATVTATRAQVYQRAGEWRFRIKGGNGEVIATGESYKSKTAAMAAVKALVPDTVKPEVTAAEG